MLLSFSIDYMRPYVEAGFRQYSGEDVGGARVKRQTIRGLGPRNERLLTISNPAAEMPLHLWWKSRTKQRAFIGAVSDWTVQKIEIARLGPGVAIQTDGITSEKQFDAFAIADGFQDWEAFRHYFVPNAGDHFYGALFKW